MRYGKCHRNHNGYTGYDSRHGIVFTDSVYQYRYYFNNPYHRWSDRYRYAKWLTDRRYCFMVKQYHNH